jgi:hypothetical protein
MGISHINAAALFLVTPRPKVDRAPNDCRFDRRKGTRPTLVTIEHIGREGDRTKPDIYELIADQEPATITPAQ